MACPTDSHTGDCTRYLGKACRPSPSRETTATALGSSNQYRIGYLWLPRYNYTTCRDIAATTLFPLSPRVSPRSAPGRAVPGRNGQGTSDASHPTQRSNRNGSAWLERSYAAVCGCPVSGAGGESRAPARGRRGGEARARSRPGRRRDNLSPAAARRAAAGTGAPPTRPAVSYFAPRFHSRLKGLSHLRIFIRPYILATPA